MENFWGRENGFFSRISAMIFERGRCWDLGLNRSPGLYSSSINSFERSDGRMIGMRLSVLTEQFLHYRQ